MKDSSKSWQGFKKHIDSIFFIFGLLLLVALAVAVMVSECIACYLQQLLGLNESENGKYDVLETIGFCIAGVLLVWQAWTTNKRAKTTEATTENTKAGQQEERLKNAIEHLGHKSASVRMGGAYELFHLAKDAKDKDTKDKDLKILRQTVLKTLCAHIRQRTKDQTATDQTTSKNKEKHKTKPLEEIQGMLTLLFAQKQGVFKGCPIDLQGSYLNGADLRWAQLQNADLRDAQLQGADLMEAQLQGANLSKAQLQGANLSKAQLQEADLWEAQLQGVASQGEYPIGFENRIRNRIDKPSDLKGIIFTGELQPGYLDTLREGLSAEKVQALRENHVGQPASHELPENSGAETGAYTQEEAERWIVKYNDAMSEAPKANDTANADSAPDSGKGKGD